MPPERRRFFKRRKKEKAHPLEKLELPFFRDPEGNIFGSMETASEISDFSDGHLRGLAIKGRVKGIKPGGRDWFISYDSLQESLESGRSFGGRPRKYSS